MQSFIAKQKVLVRFPPPVLSGSGSKSISQPHSTNRRECSTSNGHYKASAFFVLDASCFLQNKCRARNYRRRSVSVSGF